MKKNALGRGLDALLPEDNYQGSVRQIPLTELDLNPDQPRKAFDENSLAQLADSIREVGLLPDHRGRAPLPRSQAGRADHGSLHRKGL